MSDEAYAAKLRAEGHVDELARISSRGNIRSQIGMGSMGKWHPMGGITAQLTLKIPMVITIN